MRPLTQDETKFRQIAANLFKNALFYRRRMVLIHLACHHDFFTLSVRDDGPVSRIPILQIIDDLKKSAMNKRAIITAFAITMMSLVMVGLVPACFAQAASVSLMMQAANTLVSTPVVGSPLSTTPAMGVSQPSSVDCQAPLLAGLKTAEKLPAIDERQPIEQSDYSLPPCATSGGDEACIRIGVLAKRGRQHCLDQWGPTAAYLNQQIPEYFFSILPLDFDHIFEAVANQEVDFFFANSSFYVELEVGFGATRIATLNNLHSDGTGHAVFAGVIFTRADRADINDLKDLQSKRVMAVDEQSLGGWHMQWREMKAQGIDPHHDFKTLTYGGTHDAVVYAVRDRNVDAGCVRSDTLERMELEGKVALAKQVAVALMRMPASSPAAVAGTYLTI
jgi:ABC-type phosphate/phosphonate transport system substrate-binding protein